MNYLLYFHNGFVKKFPLKGTNFTIGRSRENSLSVNNEIISRKHAYLSLSGDALTIRDLNSTNGTYIKGEKITEAVINLGEAFSLGNFEFYFKRGTLDEFKYTRELEPVFNYIQESKIRKMMDSETHYITDIYDEILKHILGECLTKNNFTEIISELVVNLSQLSDMGSFFLVSRRKKGDNNIHLSIKNKSLLNFSLKDFLKSNLKLFTLKSCYKKISHSDYYFYSSSLLLKKDRAVLIFIPTGDTKYRDMKVQNFLISLAKEIELFSQLFHKEALQEKKQDFPDSYQMDHIITSSQIIKELIQQAKRIAKSNLFILICGESGTGKELFARMIHAHSARKAKQLIAINCAAIPESLLESELFGYEKGAFTGAHKKKIGKLEMASGGTLILDEIGDMPIQLQPKLLRALQENEFYRLGGNIPVKVNLRIISLTNQNLKELIKEKKFREDLYYRLVHRTMNIPPLRERKEDIPVLINYFSGKFCQQCQKELGGYSVSAFEALQNYDWKGNVRQLENEINSIINLKEENENINIDMLSDDIRQNYQQRDDSNQESGEQTMDNQEELIIQYLKKGKESEKEIILGLLKRNKWNKSQTARDLNITYQGLHKKLKKMNIEKPSQG